jgi:hypothetical protein
LQELEPETYNQLEKDCVHTAIYGKENLMYSIKSLPKHHTRSFLLNSIHPDLKRIFEYQWLRLQNIEDEDCFKYIKRILLCDWEGNISKKWTLEKM